jgi:hypothetical protein
MHQYIYEDADMALDDTAKEANIRDSLKKYFVDSLHTGEGVELTFDKYISTPNVRSKSVDRWVSINFGGMDMDVLSSLMLNIFCCTRSDGEGFKLAQLRDKVFKYLTDNTKTDGMVRIAFYRSRADGAWTLLGGGFLVSNVIESQQFEADDGTKYKVLTVTLRFSSKV